MLLYHLFLIFYRLIAKCLSPFNAKVKHWVLGQEKVGEEISHLSQKIQKPIIWVHCASYGEFEQGLPIIEQLKLTYPNYQIWLTFFSPSGYLYRKEDPHVDFVSYLPMDGLSNAKQFLDLVQPQLVIFIKYEFWFYYLSETKQRQIPTILVAALFRPEQLFFKWYGEVFKKMLSLFYAILVQDENSKKLILNIIPSQKIVVGGDTRFDRVLNTAKNATPIDWVKKIQHKKIIIAGSTWEKDHKLLSGLTKKYSQYQWIIVPHHVDSSSIQNCLAHFNKAITLSELKAKNTMLNHNDIIIVDQIGLLRNLYQYAFITYIGGGFGTDGIHNVLEPAAFGKPVIWGPHFEKHIEAMGLIQAGGGFNINKEKDFSELINQFSESNDKYKMTCDASFNFIKENAGATQKTMEYIYENRLLTN